ncbi:MAG: hypothetical protein IJS65_03335 [Clostridia bacterium]|nr:hypothetical protein [Clostridia bacterium]
MYLLEAIKRAEELRPGAGSEEYTAQSVWSLEQIFAGVTGKSVGECPYPYDAPLSIGSPYDLAYVYYAAAQNDLSAGDAELYDLDSALYNAAFSAAAARFRRNNRPKNSVNFKTV